jgi:hypothetical protein
MNNIFGQKKKISCFVGAPMTKKKKLPNFFTRHKDWRFYYLSINTRYTEPEVVMEWSLNPSVPTQFSRGTRVWGQGVFIKLLKNIRI